MMVLAKATIFAILFIVTTISAEPVRDIPEFLHICQTRDPQYETCVSNSINDLKPYLKVGVPEYNISSIEPLILKKLSISLLSMQIKFTDVNVYDVSSFEVTKMKIDFDKLFLVMDVELPNIFVEGKYDVDGKILLLPIRGFSGPVNGNFSNCIAIAKLQAEKYIDENGIERIRFVDFKIKISVGKGSVKLDNLFNGEHVLGDLINSSINNNFDLFMKKMLPMVEMTLSDAFRNISNNIVQQFSFTHLFPGL